MMNEKSKRCFKESNDLKAARKRVLELFENAEGEPDLYDAAAKLAARFITERVTA